MIYASAQVTTQSAMVQTQSRLGTETSSRVEADFKPGIQEQAGLKPIWSVVCVTFIEIQLFTFV